VSLPHILHFHLEFRFALGHRRDGLPLDAGLAAHGVPDEEPCPLCLPTGLAGLAQPGVLAHFHPLNLPHVRSVADLTDLLFDAS
jgi:hypothetical protein